MSNTLDKYPDRSYSQGPSFSVPARVMYLTITLPPSPLVFEEILFHQIAMFWLDRYFSGLARASFLPRGRGMGEKFERHLCQGLVHLADELLCVLLGVPAYTATVLLSRCTNSSCGI